MSREPTLTIPLTDTRTLNWRRSSSFEVTTRGCRYANMETQSRLWFFLYVLVIGQTLSIIITGMGVFATLFGDHTGKEVSTTMSAGAYFILSATAGPCVAYKAGFVDKLKQHWWKFLIIGLSDFYSTYLRTLALRYTSMSSNFSVTTGSYTFFVIILSLFMIRTRYKLIHYISVIISIVGIVVVVWQDLVNPASAGNNPVLGDVLCIASGILFSLTVVSEELLIKGKLNIIDYLAFLGFSATVASSIQLCALDRKTLVEIEWDLPAVLYFLGFHICDYCYYIFLALVIIKSSSTAASLSTLTSIVYSLMFAIFLFNNEFSAFYIGGFVIIMFGLVLYNMAPVPEVDRNHSVLGVGFWYNYGHSLFCEWRCCSEYDHVSLNDYVNGNNDDGVSFNDHINHNDDVSLNDDDDDDDDDDDIHENDTPLPQLNITSS